MKVLSLFDGISCGMVALERAGIPVERYVAYEIDPNAIKISKKNYPQIEHCGDVTTADFTQYQGFDLLIGGSPCQSLSIVQSQTRQHLDGKSKLFFEFVRAMEEVKPKYFLFENVASMNEESKQVISDLLGCEPIFIDSKTFSAQQRPRYYWTNIPVEMILPPDCPLVLKDILQPESEIPESFYYSAPLLNVDMVKQVCATLDIKNNEMHKRVFNPDFKCHTLTCVSGGHQQKKVLVNGRCRKLTPVEYERLQTLPDNYTAGVSNSARYTACGNGWTVDVIAHILSGLRSRALTKFPSARTWTSITNIGKKRSTSIKMTAATLEFERRNHMSTAANHMKRSHRSNYRGRMFNGSRKSVITPTVGKESFMQFIKMSRNSRNKETKGDIK